ncbi:hypothetical protein HAX54_020369 [Datura stramonium]|uniref:C2H2-type domain-containing protein n=1 Tax=Datura stramonium TaxID=4076 RepID=A0ABS8UT89_DATST|nr:hypothetical protein [Datura stramonium]
MNAFAMEKSCSSQASSISGASKESHEIVTNTKKMKEKVVEGSDSESSNEASLKQRRSSNAMNFSCRFCKKVFSTYQALGGHQNAHKKKRALSKRKKRTC